MRFRDQDIVFNGADGQSKGQNLEIPTANPANYFHVISNSADLPKLAIDGKLFLPSSDHRKRNGKLPLVRLPQLPASYATLSRTRNLGVIFLLFSTALAIRFLVAL